MPRIPKTDTYRLAFACLGMVVAGIVVFGAALILHGLDEILAALVLP